MLDNIHEDDGLREAARRLPDAIRALNRAAQTVKDQQHTAARQQEKIDHLVTQLEQSQRVQNQILERLQHLTRNNNSNAEDVDMDGIGAGGHGKKRSRNSRAEKNSADVRAATAPALTPVHPSQHRRYRPEPLSPGPFPDHTPPVFLMVAERRPRLLRQRRGGRRWPFDRPAG